jgi:hypothetical protein
VSWRIIVVGGHTRSIGKTQLVCDVISAFPQADWIAGKITQYGHGVCAQNGHDCDCAPDEHICAINWERQRNDTDSGRFLAAGASRSFWLRTKQGFLAEGLPLLREALREIDGHAETSPRNLILESNTLLQFLKPSLYLMVLDPAKSDFKDSARLQMDRASAFVLRAPVATGAGQSFLPAKFQSVPHFLQREGEPLPAELVHRVEHSLAVSEGIAL